MSPLWGIFADRYGRRTVSYINLNQASHAIVIESLCLNKAIFEILNNKNALSSFFVCHHHYRRQLHRYIVFSFSFNTVNVMCKHCYNG